jgi:hypothetical protein
MIVEANEWLQRFAAKLGIDPPSSKEQDLLLGLAGVAAHASERTAAPISCWLAARSGAGLAEASAAAKELAEELAAES